MYACGRMLMLIHRCICLRSIVYVCICVCIEVFWRPGTYIFLLSTNDCMYVIMYVKVTYQRTMYKCVLPTNVFIYVYMYICMFKITYIPRCSTSRKASPWLPLSSKSRCPGPRGPSPRRSPLEWRCTPRTKQMQHDRQISSPIAASYCLYLRFSGCVLYIFSVLVDNVLRIYELSTNVCMYVHRYVCMYTLCMYVGMCMYEFMFV